MHWTIPLLVALALKSDWDKKKLLLFSLFTLIPDLDHFLNKHRSITHSTLTLIIFPLALFMISKILNRYGEESFLFLLFLSSHFFLDFGAGGIYLFWPFRDITYYLVAALPIEGYWVSKPIIGIYNANIQIDEYQVISSYGSCIALYLIFILTIYWIDKKVKTNTQ